MTPGITAVVRHVWTHPSNRGRRLRALARAAAWQARKRLTGRPTDLRLPNGLRLRCHPDSAVAGLVLYASGVPDHAEMRFLADYLRPGDDFLDVGANIGSYVLFTAPLVGREGRVTAFEPGRAARARLLENLTLNRLHRQVEVHEAAASDRAGSARFTLAHDTQNGLDPTGDALDATEVVPTVRLDEALRGRCFAAAKLDLEGAEPLALRGASGLLAAGVPPVWLLEVNRVALRRHGSDEEALAGQLDAAGYDLAVYDPERRILTLVDRPLAPHHSNLIAIHRASRHEVDRRIPGLSFEREGGGAGPRALARGA